MLTQSDFKQAIADTIDHYPALAPLYHAGDPRLHQHLDAMAAMLSLLSGQIEVTAAIPGKARTTLVIRQKRPTTITHTVTSSEPFYAIEVPQANDDGDLCAIAVSDDKGPFHYRDPIFTSQLFIYMNSD